jgi:hypothetical protein
VRGFPSLICLMEHVKGAVPMETDCYLIVTRGRGCDPHIETNILRNEIPGFHSGEHSSRGLLCCDDVSSCGTIPMFRRTLLPPSSG